MHLSLVLSYCCCCSVLIVLAQHERRIMTANSLYIYDSWMEKWVTAGQWFVLSSISVDSYSHTRYVQCVSFELPQFSFAICPEIRSYNVKVISFICFYLFSVYGTKLGKRKEVHCIPTTFSCSSCWFYELTSTVDGGDLALKVIAHWLLNYDYCM